MSASKRRQDFLTRLAIGTDRPWIAAMLDEHWGSTKLVTRGQIHEGSELRPIVELEQVPGGGRAHRRHRCRIEQCFGHLTNLPFGLSPLPKRVRRLKRVKG